MGGFGSGEGFGSGLGLGGLGFGVGFGVGLGLGFGFGFGFFVGVVLVGAVVVVGVVVGHGVVVVIAGVELVASVVIVVAAHGVVVVDVVVVVVDGVVADVVVCVVVVDGVVAAVGVVVVVVAVDGDGSSAPATRALMPPATAATATATAMGLNLRDAARKARAPDSLRRSTRTQPVNTGFVATAAGLQITKCMVLVVVLCLTSVAATLTLWLPDERPLVGILSPLSLYWVGPWPVKVTFFTVPLPTNFTLTRRRPASEVKVIVGTTKSSPTGRHLAFGDRYVNFGTVHFFSYWPVPQRLATAELEADGAAPAVEAVAKPQAASDATTKVVLKALRIPYKPPKG